MDTIDDTQPMNSLEWKVIECFDKARGALNGFIPADVLEDIRFFVYSPDLQPTCKTNVRVAYQVGKLAGIATGHNALYVEVIWLCVMAKDMWLKGTFMPAVVDCVDKANILLNACETWQKADLNF